MILLAFFPSKIVSKEKNFRNTSETSLSSKKNFKRGFDQRTEPITVAQK